MSDVLHRAVLVLASMPTAVTVHGFLQGATEIHAPAGGLEIARDWLLFWATVIPTGLAVIASAVVAIFTARLASSTKLLASETQTMAAKTALLATETKQSIEATREASVLADRHQQENLSPIVFLALSVMRVVSSAPLPRTGSQIRWGERVSLHLRGTLRNVGTGPAFNVKVHVETAERTDDWVLPFIAANSEAPVDRTLAISDTRAGVDATVSENSAEVDDFTTRVSYQNMFLQDGATEQGKADGGDLFVTRVVPTAFVKRDLT